jgi:hypothetical protein
LLLAGEAEALAAARFLCLIVGGRLLKKGGCFAGETWDQLGIVYTLGALGTGIDGSSIRLFQERVDRVEPPLEGGAPKAVGKRGADSLTRLPLLLDACITVIIIHCCGPPI